MFELMTLLLQRLEIEPPNLGYHDLRRQAESNLARFERLGLLQPTTHAGSLDCWECGSSHYCPITFLTNEQTGSRVGYIHCPECGVQRVDLRRTKRWSIDVPSLLQTTFGNLVAGNVAITIVAERLWRIGRISLAGGSRDVYFTCCYRQRDGQQVIAEMSRRPKAILFSPTDTTVRRLDGSLECLTVPLDESIDLSGDSFALDVEYVESLLADDASVEPAKPRKRAGRAAKIELLENEMIQHLRSARDYAFAADTPELLPRPTQRELGQRCDLSESDVSRCLKDPTADYLRLLWATALDLDQIMRWQTPTGNRSRS